MPYIPNFSFDKFYNIFFKEEQHMSKQPIVLDHPLIQHKLSILRREETDTKTFRELITEIAMLMCFEATRDLETEDVEIETPVAKCVAKQLKGKQPAIVPILRAGIGMVDGMLNLLPQARVGHIGLYRDPETCKPVEYYCKLPADAQEREILLVGRYCRARSFRSRPHACHRRQRNRCNRSD